MTAKEMALAYWGYGKDYDPNNLSEELREQLIATINLMHEWEALSKEESKRDEEENDFAALYKELAILEKQSRERYQKIIADMEAAIQYGRDSINEMAKQISQQNDLIVSLEAQINQDELTKNDLRNNLMDYKEECNRLEGVARHWQMKYYDDISKIAGFDLPKIDNL